MQTTQPRLQNYCVLTKYLLSRLSVVLHHNRGWIYTMWCGTHSSWKTKWQLKCPMFYLNPKDESCPGTCDNTNKWSPFGNNVNQLPLEFFNFGIISVMNEEKNWWRIYGQVSQAAYATHLPWWAPCRPPWFCLPRAPGPLKTRSLQPGSQNNKTITSREWVCSLSEKWLPQPTCTADPLNVARQFLL